MQITKKDSAVQPATPKVCFSSYPPLLSTYLKIASRFTKNEEFRRDALLIRADICAQNGRNSKAAKMYLKASGTEKDAGMKTFRLAQAELQYLAAGNHTAADLLHAQLAEKVPPPIPMGARNDLTVEAIKLANASPNDNRFAARLWRFARLMDGGPFKAEKSAEAFMKGKEFMLAGNMYLIACTTANNAEDGVKYARQSALAYDAAAKEKESAGDLAGAKKLYLAEAKSFRQGYIWAEKYNLGDASELAAKAAELFALSGKHSIAAEHFEAAYKLERDEGKRLEFALKAAQGLEAGKYYPAAAEWYAIAFRLEPGPADKLKYGEKAFDLYFEAGKFSEAHELRNAISEVQAGGVTV